MTSANVSRQIIHKFLTNVGHSNSNARDVSGASTDLTRAILYYIARKRDFSHQQALNFIKSLSNSNMRNITRITTRQGNNNKNNNLRNRSNIYYRVRRTGGNHTHAMNAVMLHMLNFS